MDPAASFSLVVSGSALGVALYGIRERRVAARNAVRVRLTEIVESLERLKFEEFNFINEHDVGDVDGERIATAFNSRRALLVSQALSLTERYRFRADLSCDEWMQLAFGCWDLARAEEARLRMLDAVAAARTVWEKRGAYATLGQFCFPQGRVEDARSAYRTALADLRPEPADWSSWWIQFMHAEEWLEWELRLAEAGAPEEPRRCAEEIVEMPSPWQDVARKRLAGIGGNASSLLVVPDVPQRYR
jgi:hypothetical protein